MSRYSVRRPDASRCSNRLSCVVPCRIAPDRRRRRPHVAVAQDDARRRTLHDVAVGRDEDRVVGAASLGLAQRRHVHGVAQRLRAEQQPRRVRAVSRAYPRSSVTTRMPCSRAALKSAAGDACSHAVGAGPCSTPRLSTSFSANSPVRGQRRDGAGDRGLPLRQIRLGQLADARGVAQALEVRPRLLRVAVDHADGLEDAVAALGRELADAERGRRRRRPRGTSRRGRRRSRRRAAAR